ncbi:MAG: hypothetical protein WCG30_01830 [Candidatus Saccharibacteria bacterium]
MTKSNKLGLIVLTLLLATIGIVYWQSRNIRDWIKLSRYTPSSDIINLVSDDTMTPYAKRLFYINHPAFLSGASFRQECPNSASTISTILGCYHPDQNGIYIFTVNNPTLKGVEQVTAAHEVLHAIWARLPNSERNRVGALLKAYYDNNLTDPVIKDEISLYQKTEPNSVLDEMNSTFGTEIANLPPELNSYYSQFFTDRSTVVKYSSDYKSVFIGYRDQIKADDLELNHIKSQIDSNQTTIKNDMDSIASQRSDLNKLLSNHQIPEYNAGVAQLNTLIVTYNDLITQTQSLIDQYNQLVVTRNSDAIIFDDLTNQLNSNLMPIKAN